MDDSNGGGLEKYKIFVVFYFDGVNEWNVLVFFISICKINVVNFLFDK